MNKTWFAYVASVFVLIAAVLVGVTAGSVSIPVQVLWNPDMDEAASNILWNIRIPRVVASGRTDPSPEYRLHIAPLPSQPHPDPGTPSPNVDVGSTNGLTRSFSRL